MLERQLEAYFRLRVRRDLHGLSFKLAPTTAGMPDRMILLPGGRIELAELKTETGTVSPIQKVIHQRMADVGTVVQVVYGRAGVDLWIEGHK